MKNRLAQLLEEKRRSNVDIIDLTESNPTIIGLDYPEDAILASISHQDAFTYSPTPRGLETARNAVAKYYASRGLGVSSEDILLTASTSEAYSFLFKLLADPGDQILVPRPSYPLFEFLAQLESALAKPYPLYYETGWCYDLDALDSLLDQGPKALILVNPNNPTGSYIKREEWSHIKEICCARQISLICDEVFADYRLDESVHPFDPASDNDFPTFLLNGLSKTAGLPQLKLSWILLRGPEKMKRTQLENLEVIADTFLSVGTPVQRAAPDLLAMAGEIRKQIHCRVQTNYDYLRISCLDSPAQCLIAEGGWYAVLRLPRIQSEEEWILQILGATDTLVHPGYFYDFAEEAYLVLSLLPERDRFEEGVSRLLGEIRHRSFGTQ